MVKPNTAEQIIIVGAGLVGATLAALITKENSDLPITLIDRNPAPVLSDSQPYQYDSRVVALTLASQHILQSLNVWQAIQLSGACDYQQMVVWDGEGTGSIDFNAQAIGQTHLGSIVENRIALCHVLDRLSENRPVTICRGQGIQDIEQHHDGASVLLDDGQRITGALIVAADGGLSKVRELVGFKVNTSNYQQTAIIATVKTEKPHRQTAWQNFLTSGPLALLPLHGDVQHHSSIVWSADTQVADELMALTKTQFDAKLSQCLEGRLGRTTVIGERYRFPLIARHVSDYFKGRVVLAGDAAHTIHPLAGQGVNLGLQDAQCLADEITRARSRQLAIHHESVLRRYQRQRKQPNNEMLWLMQGFKTLFGERTPAIRLARNLGLNAVNKIAPLKHWLAKQASGV